MTDILVDADGKKWERLVNGDPLKYNIGEWYGVRLKKGDRWVLERPVPEETEGEKLAKWLEASNHDPGKTDCFCLQAAAYIRKLEAELKSVKEAGK